MEMEREVEVKGRIATWGQPLKFYCETPVPMNLHGNSPPRRDVYLVRINSVTSNERREDGEELRRRCHRKDGPRRSIRPSSRRTSVYLRSNSTMNMLNRLRTANVLIFLALFLVKHTCLSIFFSIIVTLVRICRLLYSALIRNKSDERNWNCH